ncbi:MAG: hypothetical protein FJY10_12110 [Bacteroidetes bacterium]|nr:hypothetical protein [Bacteroidota bacterium]
MQTNEEVPGCVNKDSLIFGDFCDYYTFSDINGNEKSEWFSGCILNKSSKPYNNIVFIETGNGHSYSNFFLDCYDMTIMGDFRNNYFGNKVHGNIIGVNAAENSINGSFNCVQNEFYYNQVSSYVFSNSFKNILNTCTFHHNVLDSVFGETVQGQITRCFFANMAISHIPDNTILTTINGEGNFSPDLTPFHTILASEFNKNIVCGEGGNYFLSYINASGSQVIVQV